MRALEAYETYSVSGGEMNDGQQYQLTLFGTNAITALLVRSALRYSKLLVPGGDFAIDYAIVPGCNIVASYFATEAFNRYKAAGQAATK